MNGNILNGIFKGIFNRDLPFPQYANIWDINTLLIQYDMPPNSALDFKCLYKKLVTLFLILGIKRKQGLTSITVKFFLLDLDNVALLPNKTPKYSTPNCTLKLSLYAEYKTMFSKFYAVLFRKTKL